MPWPRAPRPVSSMEKALGEFWTQHLGTDGAVVCGWEPLGASTPRFAAQEQQKRQAQGEGTRNWGEVWAQNLLCVVHSTLERPGKSLSPCPVTSKAVTPLPHTAFAVVAHCLCLDIHCVLVKALRTQNHRFLCIFTPVIIHPVISDWSVVFIFCYSSVSCLKCFQSRPRKSCPVPNQTHTAELTGTKHFPNILVSTQHVETTQPSSAALICPQRRLCLLW